MMEKNLAHRNRNKRGLYKRFDTPSENMGPTVYYLESVKAIISGFSKLLISILVIHLRPKKKLGNRHSPEWQLRLGLLGEAVESSQKCVEWLICR